MDLDILKVIITVTLAVIGWLVGHGLTSKRDQKLKRRDLKVSYLLEAYRKLDRFIAVLIGSPMSTQIAEGMNSAISDIQLFGTPSQIELAVKITKVLAIEKSVPTPELNELTQTLRADLRKELGLESVDSKIAYLNMNYENTKNT